MMPSVIKALFQYEALIQGTEYLERHTQYRRARQYCNQVGKPLLRIGVRRSPLEPPNGDVTLDIDPIVRKLPGGVWGDERNMPFGDKEFGACFNEHTLEHLHNAEDVAQAVKECVRVADRAIFLTPSPYSIFSSFFSQTHYLRLWLDQKTNKIMVTPSKFRIGIGSRPRAITNTGEFLQALVVDGVEPVVEERR